MRGFDGRVTVYHGTTSLIDEIDVTKGKPYKDFGRGFYVTRSRIHAEKLAIRNKRVEIERYKNTCEAYLYTYELDGAKLSSLSVKIFAQPDFEWVRFVLANRKSRNSAHAYDVVVGPTADDDTLVVINAYLDGLYGEINSDSALNTLLKNIEAENLPEQIFFSNNEAVRLLQRQEIVKLAHEKSPKANQKRQVTRL
ncbi:MAG: DUF3990 domain-containing protein [Defluviitaleaceae bacterium]|nr:DUF3990 domain-containing protein [Defluviitaleaceae bacterium]